MDVSKRDDDARMAEWEGMVDLFFVVSLVIGFPSQCGRMEVGVIAVCYGILASWRRGFETSFEAPFFWRDS